MSVGEDEVISAGVRRASRRIIDTSDSEMSEGADAVDTDEDESDEERDEVSLSCVNFVYKSLQFNITII
jgi:hypothetical protein